MADKIGNANRFARDPKGRASPVWVNRVRFALLCQEPPAERLSSQQGTEKGELRFALLNMGDRHALNHPSSRHFTD